MEKETKSKVHEQIELTPELITNPFIAAKALIAGVETAYKMGVFSDMQDVSTLNKSKEVLSQFLTTEQFMRSNYNKLLKTTNYRDAEGNLILENGQTQQVVLFVQLDEPKEQDIDGFIIDVYTVPAKKYEEDSYFMYLNSNYVQLHPGQTLLAVNGQILVYGFPQQIKPPTREEINLARQELVANSKK